MSSGDIISDFVYKTNLISTIVDASGESMSDDVYKTNLISTIVDWYLFDLGPWRL